MRNSFLYQIPAIDLAINYLDQAANAFLNNDLELVSELLIKSDIKEIALFYSLIVGATQYPIYWQTKQPKSLQKRDRSTTRMPSPSVEDAIFNRDGWKCRFCGTKVISRKARKVLATNFPTETHWVQKEFERHASLHCQAASLDYIVPHCCLTVNSTMKAVAK